MTNVHEIRWTGPAIEKDRVQGASVKQLLDILVEGTRRAVRFRLAGRSKTPGAAPAWLKKAAAFYFLPGADGSVIKLDARPLSETAEDKFRQMDMFDELDPTKSSLDLFEDGLEDALKNRFDSDLFDEGLVETYSSFRGLFEEGINSLVILNGREVTVDPSGVQTILAMEGRIPPPQHVRLVGKLEEPSYSQGRFKLVLNDGKTIRGVAENIDVEKLRKYFAREVLVEGTAYFKPSGNLLRLEAEDFLSVSQADREVFATSPSPLLGDIDPRTLRETQGSRSGVNAIWGKWPGNETDEEIAKIIEEIS